jgi:hypothetical protein
VTLSVICAPLAYKAKESLTLDRTPECTLGRGAPELPQAGCGPLLPALIDCEVDGLNEISVHNASSVCRRERLSAALAASRLKEELTGRKIFHPIFARFPHPSANQNI